jgi:hypothetical protein
VPTAALIGQAPPLPLQQEQPRDKVFDITAINAIFFWEDESGNLSVARKSVPITMLVVSVLANIFQQMAMQSSC